MLDLAEDPARARRFGAAGRAHAKRYSWQRFAERFDRVLEEVAR
jgi:glycosyltransferase involved in cell wall biosynthesis